MKKLILILLFLSTETAHARHLHHASRRVHHHHRSIEPTTVQRESVFTEGGEEVPFPMIRGNAVYSYLNTFWSIPVTGPVEFRWPYDMASRR